MKPNSLGTKIFLDSGDPAETREVLSVLGFLDGQTTNPSLIAKNPETAGKKFTKDELLNFYRGVVEEISILIPNGSVSIEVYADAFTTADKMLAQGREFNKWIPGAHIKYPTTPAGLEAAEQSVAEGMKVNMTLVFSQQQAAAVYAATLGAQKGQVYVSPFVGRLDDLGERGMDLISNIIKMYENGDGHVEVLTASVRSNEHILEAISLGSDILTAPVKILTEAKSEILNSKSEMDLTSSPQANFNAGIQNLKPIPYQNIDLKKPWQEYNIQHQLTDKGLEKFASDWNSLIE